MALCAMCALVAAREIRFVLPVAVVLVILLAAAVIVAEGYLRAPLPGSGKRVELVSGLWTLAMYVSVGIAPLVLRHWGVA
jgi:4-hydroxybenzoate polyprenyltransferase